MLPRMAFGLGMAFGLALAGPGLAVVGGNRALSSHSSLVRKKSASTVVRRWTLRCNAKTAIRPSEPNSFVGWSRLRECQQKRRVSEQGLSLSPADTRRRCTPDIQLWSMTGNVGAELVSS